MITRAVAAALAAVAVVSLAGCGDGTPAATPGVVRVTAAENFWGDIASQIGGDHVQITSIISDPNTDPHLYESDPRTAAAIATAQLVIENGLGYDSFVDKALAVAGGSDRHLIVVQDVLGVDDDANPHLWYWTARLPEVGYAIAQQLSAIDPDDAAVFEAGERRFEASLKPLLATIATIKRKYAGTPIAYTERVPGYLVEAAGLTLGTPVSFSESIEEGNDPSPQDAATFDADITTRKVKALLYNAQVVDAATAQIRQLALTAHVPVVPVTETMPVNAVSFQAWQLKQDRDLLRALGG